MPKFYCNKLGRDKGRESFAQQEITVHYKILLGHEWQKQLKHKLLEEAREVAVALDVKEVVDELADILEVVDGLCAAYGIDATDLARAKQCKKEERGGFQKAFYVEYIEMAEDNPRTKHFRSSPDKYPEE